MVTLTTPCSNLFSDKLRDKEKKEKGFLCLRDYYTSLYGNEIRCFRTTIPTTKNFNSSFSLSFSLPRKSILPISCFSSSSSHSQVSLSLPTDIYTFIWYDIWHILLLYLVILDSSISQYILDNVIIFDHVVYKLHECTI